MAARSVNPFRAHIREATRPAHERLDRRMSALNLGTRHGYEIFLRATAGALIPLEREIGDGAPLTDWPRRRRTDALARDLDRLGLTSPRPVQPPPLTSGPARLGAIYVLEGSRLGGKLILQAVEQDGDAEMRAATAYLRHGETGRLFHGFLDAASVHLTGAADIEAASASAGAVFEIFEESLQRALSEAPAEFQAAS